MRKVSQSLQPKVGRLCTATNPSYPCHLPETYRQPGGPQAGGGEVRWASERDPPGPSPGLLLPPRPHLPPPPDCTSSPHHSQPAERETEAERGTLPCPRPHSSSHPSQILPLVQSAVRQAPPLNRQGGRGGDPGGSRRFIVGAEPGPPLLLGSVLTARALKHIPVTTRASPSCRLFTGGSAARPPPHFEPPHLPTMCGHQSF